jgi:hypothetical protein
MLIVKQCDCIGITKDGLCFIKTDAVLVQVGSRFGFISFKA